MVTWQKINEVLHGETKRECTEKIKLRLRLHIKELYSMDRSRMEGRDKRLFKLPCRQRIKGGIVGMNTWIAMTEMAFQKIQDPDMHSLEF